jgi:hypothetical protein
MATTNGQVGEDGEVGRGDDPVRATETVLDALDETLIELKATGKSDTQAADEAGCCAKTVQRRRKNPAFAAALSARKAERVAEAAGMLGEASIKAVATMEECLSAPKEADRLRAAGQIVSSLVRLRAESELEATIEELRADIAELKNAIRQEGAR